MFERMERCGVIPVVKIDNAEQAVPLARALYQGGLDVIEITFRTAAAAEAIRRIAQECPEIMVGAGTVVTPENFRDAVRSGAKFAVSPGLNPSTVRMAREAGIPMLPGIVTPSEIEEGLELGLSVFKFFPSEAFGGLKTIEALSGPYNGIRFVPTGGVSEGNMGAYLRSPHIVAVGGSWLAPKALLDRADYAAVTALAAKACAEAREAKGQV